MDRCISGYGIAHQARLARVEESPEQRDARQRRALRKDILAFLRCSPGYREQVPRPTPVQQSRYARKEIRRAVEAYEDSQRRGIPQSPICASCYL